MRWPLKRLIVAGALLGALAFAIWEAATATVRDVIVETAYIYPYWISEGRTVRYRLSCRSWPTEAVARQTLEEYAAVFHRIDSLGRSPSYVAVKLNTRNCPGKAALDIVQVERSDYDATQAILSLVGGDTRLIRHPPDRRLFGLPYNKRFLGLPYRIVLPD